MIHDVELAAHALKQLRKAPKHVALKLAAWINDVSERGLEEVRKVPGFNDHPLKGHLAGKRAIRLSLQWRAVYEVRDNRVAEFVFIEEVHPHDY